MGGSHVKGKEVSEILACIFGILNKQRIVKCLFHRLPQNGVCFGAPYYFLLKDLSEGE